MANRFRELIRSVLYIGMNSDARTVPAYDVGLFGVLKRILSPPAPSDPLYLTNRTFGQRCRGTLLFALPAILASGIVAFGMAYYAAKHPRVVKVLTNEERAAQVLPNFAKDIKLEHNSNLEVIAVRFEHSHGNWMFGSLKNRTTHVIGQAVVTCDLIDDDGSQLGGVTITETGLAAGAVRSFRQSIDQNTARGCVVRDVSTH